jgi:hypothetical protein
LLMRNFTQKGWGYAGATLNKWLSQRCPCFSGSVTRPAN